MKSLFLILLLVLVIGSTNAFAETPATMNGLPLIFEEDFSKGSTRWTATDDNAWEVINDEDNAVFSLYEKSDYDPPVRSPRNIALIKDLNLTDFVFQARVKQSGREYGHRDLCVFLGHQDSSHFYYIHIASKADPHAHSIFLVNAAPRVSIAKERTEGVDWGSGYHQIRIERDSTAGTIKVYFDDMKKPIMMTEDKTFLSGGIGLGSFDDTGYFDDIRIWGKIQ